MTTASIFNWRGQPSENGKALKRCENTVNKNIKLSVAINGKNSTTSIATPEKVKQRVRALS